MRTSQLLLTKYYLECAREFSDEFKSWFEGSKVVDDQGNPKVVYKGMYPYDWTQEPARVEVDKIQRTTEFPAFNKDEPGINIAGFFGDAETASSFARLFNPGSVFPVYLSIKNPWVKDASGAPAGVMQFEDTGKEFRDAMRSSSYDGAIILNTSDEHTIYVAKTSDQIRFVLSKENYKNAN